MIPAERRRLARILGMLGSEHAGERENAAQQAEVFRKKHGLTWEQMLAPRVINITIPPAAPPAPPQASQPPPDEPPRWTPPPPLPWWREGNRPERLKALVYVVVMIGGAILINVLTAI